MKIAFIINDLTIGGAQRLFIELANRLAERGYEVTFISLFVVKDRLNLRHALSEQVTVHQLTFASSYDRSSWSEVAKLLKDANPRVVFSTLFFANVVARVVRPWHKGRVIVVEQNTYDTKRGAFIFLDWLLSFGTDLILCTSETVASFTSRQEKIPRNKFKVIHTGVDVKRLLETAGPDARVSVRREIGIPADARIFLNVARLTEQKGQDLLIRSFARAWHEGILPTSVHLVIVGEGSLRTELEARIRELGVVDRVHLIGARQDVPDFYAAADYFVSTSRIEGFSIVHAEAMAFGLPLLSTKTAGPDVMLLPGKNGYFVEGTEDSVLRGIRDMLAADYAAMQAASRERANEFSIESTVTEYETLLKTYQS